VRNVVISQRTTLGACHQEAVACLWHEDKNLPQGDILSMRACKPCVECGRHCSLKHTVARGEMYCKLCNPRFFRTQLKPFEEMGS
jgi:hypothetical protein